MAEQRWLRNRVTGTIYEWNPILADNPKCEEVTEQEAFPERFASPKVKSQKTKKVNLFTEEIPPEQQVGVTLTDPVAQKGLPK